MSSYHTMSGVQYIDKYIHEWRIAIIQVISVGIKDFVPNALSEKQSFKYYLLSKKSPLPKSLDNDIIYDTEKKISKLQQIKNKYCNSQCSSVVLSHSFYCPK